MAPKMLIRSYSDSDRHNVTIQRGVGQNGDFQTVTEGSCDGLENGTFPHGEKDCDGVTVENPLDESDKNLVPAKSGKGGGIVGFTAPNGGPAGHREVTEDDEIDRSAAADADPDPEDF